MLTALDSGSHLATGRDSSGMTGFSGYWTSCKALRYITEVMELGVRSNTNMVSDVREDQVSL
jgi:hypothetical protein